MALEDDMEMIEMMVVEATEHLDSLDAILINWEQDTSVATSDEMNQAFRNLHTIKGGFAFFGLNKIKELAHVMEQLLDEVRQEMRELTVDLVGRIADGANLLRMMVEDVWTSNDVEIMAMCNRLAGAESDRMVQTSQVMSDGLIRPTTAQWQRIRGNSWSAFVVTVYSNRDLLDKDRNVIDISHALNSLGEVLDVLTDFSEIDGLDDSLVSEHRILVLYATMAPRDMLVEELAVSDDQVIEIRENEAVTKEGETITISKDGKKIEGNGQNSNQEKEEQSPTENAAADSSSQTGAASTDTAPSQPTSSDPVTSTPIDSAVSLDANPLTSSMPPAADNASKAEPAPAAKAEPTPTAKPATKPESAGDKTRKAAKPAETIRVPVDSIERLLNMSGELVLLRNEVRQFFEIPVIENQLGMNLANRGRQIIEQVTRSLAVDDDQLVESAVHDFERHLSQPLLRDRAVHQIMRQMESISNKIQDTVMQLRLQPVSVVFQKVPRMVRGLAQTLNKKIKVETFGGDVELDKTVIEALSDPFTHMVRNSCDHGVETPEQRVAAGKPEEGTVTVAARHEAGSVLIDIMDDGAGIDHQRLRKAAVEKGVLPQHEVDSLSEADAVRLIFHPGFSMAQEVSEVSGRGVGMDVVLSTIERLGGSVDIETVIGVGTTFTLRMPLTLAIMSALIVESSDQRFAIPQVALQEICLTSAQQPLERIGDTDVFRLRGQLVPVLCLKELLGLPHEPRGPSEERTLVIAASSHGNFALEVDGVVAMLDIVVKPLIDELNCGVYAGATILGNGSVAPILDLGLIGRRTGPVAADQAQALAEDDIHGSGEQGDFVEMVVLRGPDDARWAVDLSQVERLVRVVPQEMEKVGGVNMVQLSGQIIPLVNIADVLPERRKVPRHDIEQEESVPVVLYQHGRHVVGLVAEKVLDVMSCHIDNKRPPSRHGVQYCASIQGRIHEFLDIEVLVNSISGVLDEAFNQTQFGTNSSTVSEA